MIKAVFFDLYETLITEWDGNRKKAIYSTDELGMDPKLFKEEWDIRRELRMDGTFPDHQSVLRDILSTHDIKATPDIIERVHQGRILSKAAPFKEMHPGVLELLKKLQDLNVKLGLISNCAPEEVLSWNTCELSRFFDAVIFSYEVKHAKPSRKIYQIACEKIGVTPEESIFIGDGGANELFGATEAGMKAYQATWFLPRFISEKNTEFPKLSSPIELLTQEITT